MRAHIPSYDLVVPENLQEALNLLDEEGGFTLIAGGTDIMVLLEAGIYVGNLMVSEIGKRLKEL